MPFPTAFLHWALKAGEPLLPTVPCLAVSWRPRAGGAGEPRAVVMGWGLMRETD